MLRVDDKDVVLESPRHDDYTLAQEPPKRVYYVIELNGEIKIRSIAIAKESDRAFVLESSYIPHNSLVPKRVLLKGIDIISLDERTAVQNYAKHLQNQLAELESTIAHTRRFLHKAQEAADKLDSYP